MIKSTATKRTRSNWKIQTVETAETQLRVQADTQV